MRASVVLLISFFSFRWSDSSTIKNRIKTNAGYAVRIYHGPTVTVADIVCVPVDAVIVTVICTVVGDVLNVSGVRVADRGMVTVAGTVTSSG